jgi:hypothetical protein
LHILTDWRARGNRPMGPPSVRKGGGRGVAAPRFY